MRIIGIFSFICLIFPAAMGQYAPAAGQAGSTAMHADSSAFVMWAHDCVLQRGYRDIARPELGEATVGLPPFVVGTPNGAVLSLGDGGVATLTFPQLIFNGPGSDFAVFENAFSDTFLELAFVEVSSDGERFVRFPAISLTQDTQQIDGFGALDPTKIHNLAGKYRSGFGMPFDLEDLKDSIDIDLMAITHVRIIDVVGAINPVYGNMDSEGRYINDPWPTPFESSGFDLNAIGVIHAGMPTHIGTDVLHVQSSIYPSILKALPNQTITITGVSPSMVWMVDLYGRKSKMNVIKHSEDASCWLLNDAPQQKGMFFLEAHYHDHVQNFKMWRE